MNRGLKRFFLDRLPDKIYLQLLWHEKFGGWINWDKPKTFNEKLQWLKIYNRNPLYTMMVDKYDVKKYVASKIGEKHIIPALGVWDDFNEIPFEILPDKFVLKTTHDSGGGIYN